MKKRGKNTVLVLHKWTKGLFLLFLTGVFHNLLIFIPSICCYSTNHIIIHSLDRLCKRKPYNVNPTFALMVAVLHSVWFLCKTNLEH